MGNSTSFTTWSDAALIDEAKRLVATERAATAALLRALMEIDARQLYLGEGCPSLFAYCTEVLHLAEGAAYNRIEAARASRRFPQLLKALEAGDLTLTTVRLLSKHLTSDNIEAVMATARHKSKRDVELLVASLNPRPPVPTVIRRVPAPLLPEASAAAVGPAIDTTSHCSSEDGRVSVAATDPPGVPRRPASVAQPLAPELFKIQFTTSRATHDKLRRAQDLLRHAIPDGDPAEIFDRALTLLIADAERKRSAIVVTPRGLRAHAGHGSRHVPAHVRREVWKRDGGRCAFIGREGRCSETAFIEFHHVEPYAAGGAATLEKIQLRCRSHNSHEARLFFGAEFVRERSNSFSGSDPRLRPNPDRSGGRLE